MVAADAGWWIASYLAGSLPTGLVVGRMRGVDLRKAGSGNIGATNAGRVLGRPFFALVFALDFLKSFVPTLLALRRDPVPDGVAAPLLALGCGVAAVVGHVFSVFLRFKGGKGVATGFGIFLALAPWTALAGLATWVGVYLATKVSSIGSLAGTLVSVLSAFYVLGSTPITWAGAVIGALIWWRHRENIGRLVRGEEAGFKR